MGAKQNLALALERMGRLEEAWVLASESMAEAHTTRSLRMEAGAKLYLARIEQRRGNLASAEAEARAALELGAKVPGLRESALGMLAELLLDAGRPAEALDAARTAYEALPALGAFEGATQLRLAYARALLATGQPEAARAALQIGPQFQPDCKPDRFRITGDPSTSRASPRTPLNTLRSPLNTLRSPTTRRGPHES